MATIDTFSSFTTARLGIYAAQAGLTVTGNNVSNINTEGYTRQRIDQVSLRTGARDHYQSAYSLNFGNGALVAGISQIRDPYLDIRYRSAAASVGMMDTKLSIRLADANPDPKTDPQTDRSVLIDGIYGTQIAVGDAEDNYTIYLAELKDSKGRILTGSEPVTLDDNDLYGSLQATRELLTEAGEFSTQDTIENVDEDAAIKRGIPYYQKCLDLLAAKIAQVFNEANTGYMVNENGEYLDSDGEILNIPEDVSADETALAEYLAEHGVQPEMAGNLFSVRGDSDDDEGITAANISVSASWATGDVRIVSSYTIPAGMDTVASTDNSNILHLVAMMGTDLDYYATEIEEDAGRGLMFQGTFGEMLTNMSTVLGNDQKTTRTLLDVAYTDAVQLDTSRYNVSSVDLNDEAANIYQYQKAYSAACRLMTAIDQMLDKLINGTGVVGL